MDYWRQLFPLRDDPTGQRLPCHTCGRLLAPLDLYPSNTCSQCHSRVYAFNVLESPTSTKAEVQKAASSALMFYALPYKVRATAPLSGLVSITRERRRGSTSFVVTDLRSQLIAQVATKRQANWVAQLIESDHYLATRLIEEE